MSCKECIWDKTREFVNENCHLFYCKGVDNIAYPFEEVGYCPAFEHKDYPKKLEL
jgi:hypothetical protein